MRVIAQFPDVTAGGPVQAAAEASGGEPLPHPGRPRLEPVAGRSSRRAGRSIFPTWSVAALAVVAAVIWSFVAIRERSPAGGRRPEPRLAVEPARTSASSGTVSR